ncbi:MAG: heavy metal translocating P-type ATPase [Bacillota bacterium]|nr:heavy metal translocating P-type ATPase [Bacillota bacterium]
MNKRQRKMLYRCIISGVLFAPLMILLLTGQLNRLPYEQIRLGLFLIPYIVIGYDIYIKAFRNLRTAQLFDETLLMAIATFAAFAIHEYEEAVAVMLFYQVGELFQSYAVGKSRESIKEMMDLVPEIANVETEAGIEEVDPDDVEVGSVIVVRPGERIPLDGVVIEGSSLVDTAALTGESVPRTIGVGDEALSGCVNGNKVLKIRVTKAFEDSTITRILELVENASSKKARLENFISRFARYYTPVVTIAAVLLAVIPPLVLGGGWSDWIERACIFLVVSCPCALVISVPLGFFGGIGASSRMGVLVKGGNYLEVLGDVDTVVFDKTGTITKGEFKVTNIYSPSMKAEELLEIAALGESCSTHPIAESIITAYGHELDMSRIANVDNMPGKGIRALIDNRNVLIGNAKLMDLEAVDYEENPSVGTVVYIAIEGLFAGSIVISDKVKDDVRDAIESMKAQGVKRCIMLTGDRKDVSDAVSAQVGIDEVRSELLPQDKVSEVESLLQNQHSRSRLAFVGDGINDAPVLMRADVGIAMGSMGSDAAIEAADIVIMDDDLRKISTVIRIARKTMRIVKSNVVFAIGIKVLVLVLGALGIANMWGAVFADVGVAIIAILNSTRTLRIK